MDRLQAPAATDKLTGEPLEELRVGGRIGLGAEIAWGRDQAGAEILLPDPVDDDAGREAARSGFGIGDPAGQGRAAPRADSLLPRSLAPRFFRRSGEDLEKPRRGDPLALADVAATQKPGLGIGVRIAAAIGMMGDRREMVAGNQRRDGLRLRPRPLQGADESIGGPPALVGAGLEPAQLGRFSGGSVRPRHQVTDQPGIAPGPIDRISFWRDRNRGEPGDGGGSDSRPPDRMVGAGAEVEGHHQPAAGGEPDRLGEIEVGYVRLSDVGIDCPPTGRAVVDGVADVEARL